MNSKCVIIPHSLIGGGEGFEWITRIERDCSTDKHWARDGYSSQKWQHLAYQTVIVLCCFYTEGTDRSEITMSMLSTEAASR